MVNSNATLLGSSTFIYANPINVVAGNTGVSTITVSGANTPTFAGLITLAHDLTIIPGNAITASGGIVGTGNLTLASVGAGTVTLSTAAVNNTGTITNNGAGTGLSTISGGIGSNVSTINQSSTTSALTISTTALSVNGTGTTLNNTAGTKVLTLSGGTNGTGDLILNNNSSTAAGITVSGTAVNNTGKITVSGTGSGAVTFSSPIGANVTGITQSSSAAFSATGATTIGSGGFVLNDNSSLGLTVAAVNGPGTITSSGTGSGVTTISGIIGSSVTGVVQNGTSQLTLNGVNTFTNGLTIKKGTVFLGNVSAATSTLAITLGDTDAVSSSATLLAQTGTFPNAINVVAGSSGTLTIGSSGAFAPIYAGAVTLSHDVTFANTAAGSQLYATGGMGGTGNVTLSESSANPITLSGAAINPIGTITSGGSGAGTVTISANIGSNVTGISQNSPTAKLVLTGTNSYTGSTTVTAGELDAAMLPANSALAITSSTGGSIIKLTTGTAHAFTQLSSLTTTIGSGTASLNFTNHDLLVASGAATQEHTLSSHLAAVPAPSGTLAFYTTGLLDGNAWASLYGAQQFHSQSVGSDALVLAYTYAGDATLDGVITADDYAQIDAGYLLGLVNPNWLNGDFNHDGVVDASDYALIDWNYVKQSGPAAEGMIALHSAMFGAEYTSAMASLSAVPEPASLALLGMGMAGLLARRGRRQEKGGK